MQRLGRHIFQQSQKSTIQSLFSSKLKSNIGLLNKIQKANDHRIESINSTSKYFHSELFRGRNIAASTTQITENVDKDQEEEDREREDPQVSQNIDQYNSRYLTFLLIGTPLAYLALIELMKWIEEEQTDAKKLVINDLERIFDQFTLKNGIELCKEFNINMANWIFHENESNYLEKKIQNNNIIYSLYAMHIAGFVGCSLLKKFNPTLFKRFMDRHVVISLNNMYEGRFHTLILGQFAHRNVLSLLLPLLCINSFATDYVPSDFSQYSLLALYLTIPALACVAHSSVGATLLRYFVSPNNRILQYRVAKMGQFNIIHASFFALFFAPLALTSSNILDPYIDITNLELSYILFGLQFLNSIRSKTSPMMIAEMVAFYSSYFALKHVIEREEFQRPRIVEKERISYFLGEKTNVKRNGMAIFIPDDRKTMELRSYKNDKMERVLKTKALLEKDYTE